VVEEDVAQFFGQDPAALAERGDRMVTVQDN